MATSSIFANVRITDSKKAEAFIDALDVAANSSNVEKKMVTNSLVTDANAIRTIIAKRNGK